MSLTTNKLESSLNLHVLEKYCEARLRDEINLYGSRRLSASDEVKSFLDRSTKYVTLVKNSPSAIGVDIPCDTDSYCGICRVGRRRKNEGVLEHGFIKYLIDQTEFLREEIKVKNKIIYHLLKL